MTQGISGIQKISLKPFKDFRGSFTRLYQMDFWEKNSFQIKNVNFSQNPISGTLRGFHFSDGPEEEDKIFHCLAGSIYNVTIDVRKGSKTYGQMEVNVLEASTPQALFVPGGCANAWLTLQDHTEILYLVSCPYDPKFERGFRFDDSAFNIPWPATPKIISEKDLSWKPFVL